MRADASCHPHRMLREPVCASQFIDDVQTVFLASASVTRLEHIEVQPAGSDSTEQALRIHYTAPFGRHRTLKKCCFTVWLPEGVLSPATARQQPGGDVWLNSARDVYQHFSV